MTVDLNKSSSENAGAESALASKSGEHQRKAGAPSGQRRRIFTRKDGWTIFLFMLPALLFVGVFTYYPMISGSQMAFRKWKLSNLTETPWVWFDNFKAVFENPSFGTIAWNTVVWVVVSLVFQFLIGFAIALWLRKKFRFRGLYQALIFFPWAISGFLIGIMFRWMFNGEFGVVNDLLMKFGLIEKNIAWLSNPDTAMAAILIANIWYGVTFFAIMLLAALQSVPEELYEAAALDGAGKVRTLFSVTIPYISATIALTVLLRVIWIFNFPDLIWAMTNGGPADQTHIFTTWMIQTTQKGDYGTASAMGLIVVAFLLLFAVFYLMATTEKSAKNSRKGAVK